MRIAIVSDIHGNLTALEAVLADLRLASPDLTLHAGDLLDSGASPIEIADLLRDLRWPGVLGNTDELLTDPTGFESFAAPLPQLTGLWAAIREMAAFTRDALGPTRLAWLAAHPRTYVSDAFAVVHATPASLWHAPAATASGADLSTPFVSLERPTVIYGHVHHPFVRDAEGLTIINTGSVGQPHDGDPRASYLLLADGAPLSAASRTTSPPKSGVSARPVFPTPIGSPARWNPPDLACPDQTTTNSFPTAVNTSHPVDVTSTVSSIRTPPTPSTYTPGSIVIAIPAFSLVLSFFPNRGGS